MKRSPNVILKKRYLTARQRYLEKLKTFEPKQNRTIKDTARVLDALKLQHQFIISEKRRLIRTINNLKKNGKPVDQRLKRRLKKITIEDNENQARKKSIENYFLQEVREP